MSIVKEETKTMFKAEEVISEIKVAEKSTLETRLKPGPQGMNAINKGSKVTGNIVVSQDLYVTGDIEGNITGENNSNIFIKGSCKGNIKTAGSIEIDGEISGGDIAAGGYVKITGKFNGGKIQAKERIHINGEFTGSLESSEIEVGASAKGKGEIFYKESLSIEKGAKVEGRITRIEGDRKPEPVKKEEPKQIKKGFFAT